MSPPSKQSRRVQQLAGRVVFWDVRDDLTSCKVVYLQPHNQTMWIHIKFAPACNDELIVTR